MVTNACYLALTLEGIERDLALLDIRGLRRERPGQDRRGARRLVLTVQIRFWARNTYLSTSNIPAYEIGHSNRSTHPHDAQSRSRAWKARLVAARCTCGSEHLGRREGVTPRLRGLCDAREFRRLGAVGDAKRFSWDRTLEKVCQTRSLYFDGIIRFRAGENDYPVGGTRGWSHTRGLVHETQ